MHKATSIPQFAIILSTVALSAAFTFAQVKVWTTQDLFKRNIGTKEQQMTAFAPHKIVGNIR